MSLIEVIMFMRTNDVNRADYEDPDTGDLHTILRKYDGFYMNGVKVCEL